MERSGKQGLGAAYRAGFGWGWNGATTPWSRWTPTCPTPDRLPALLDGLATADLVIGSRYVPGGGRSTGAGSRRSRGGGNAYVRLALGMPVHDCTAGYRAYRREVLEASGDTVRSNGYCFQVEMVHKTWQEGFVVPRRRSPSPNGPPGCPR